MAVPRGDPFMAGLVNSYVRYLVTVQNVLYALTPMEMLKSADGGESWESVGLKYRQECFTGNTKREGRNSR